MDIKTLVLIFLIINIINAATMTIIWRQYRKRFNGLSLWLADMILQVIGMGLILARGSIPDFASIVLSNTLILSGMLLLLIGLEKFLDKKGNHIQNYALIFIFLLSSAYYSEIKPDITMREITLSIVIIIIGFQTGKLLLHKVPKGLGRITRITGIVMSGYAAVSVLRLILISLFNPSGTDFFKSGFISAFTILVFLTLNICLIISLILMVTRRLLAEVSVQEEKYAKTFHSSPYAILLTTLSDGRIFELNEGFLKLSGYQYDEVIGKTTFDLNFWAEENDREIIVNELSVKGRIEEFEIPVRKKSGEFITVMLSADTLVINNEQYIISSISDITGRKKSEEKIKSLLHEKEIILKEVHHRIKNNMSTVNALLFLQADDQENSNCRDILNNAGTRVQSMITLYDKLYKSDNYRELSVKEFLTALTAEITGVFSSLVQVRTKIMIQDFNLRTETLSSLGIILNELITNSMKYAFKDTRSGLILLSAEKNGDTVTIIYSDDGAGLPESVTLNSSGGFGMQLISMLVDQIHGSVDIERNKGTRFTITFNI